MKKVLIQDHLLFPEIIWEMPQNIYKRQRGKILILAGSRGMTGAAILASEAAYRAGVGILTLGFPESEKEVYRKIIPEDLTLPLPSTKSGTLSLEAKDIILEKINDFDLVLMGPGLSENPETSQLIWELIFEIDKPLILDADAINALSAGLQIIKNKIGLEEVQKYLTKIKSPVIITPHGGEALKFYKAIKKQGGNIKANFIEKNKNEIAKEIAEITNFIVVLKGHNTVIADVSGKRIINKTGGPGLAKAGTGDILSGIIATFVSQNINKRFKAVATAVYLHGLAGDIAEEKIGQRSIIATDVIKYLGKAIEAAEKEIK